MIPDGILTQRGADDGDLITREVLKALHPAERTPSPPGERPAPGPVPLAIARPSLANAEVRAAARAWLGACSGTQADEAEQDALLHAVETSALTRPPLPRAAKLLDADLAGIYLALARHWVDRSRRLGDPRFLNAALKLLAVALQTPVPCDPAAPTALAEALGALKHLEVPSATPVRHEHGEALATVEPLVGRSRARITVLAGAASSGLPLFLASAARAGVPITATLLHAAGPTEAHPGSAYASAWYPKPGDGIAAHRVDFDYPLTVPRRPVAHGDWAGIARALTVLETDLLVLLGMDVVPAPVLDAARLGAINAHNGALPGYRGMDAVAWALLAGDPVVCSVHQATMDVDAGNVLAHQAVPADGTDLRRAVKAAQIALLTGVCQQVHATGQLPKGELQAGAARRYYRMHPALRRLLDQRPAAVLEGPR